jgi:hypothetical protein
MPKLIALITVLIFLLYGCGSTKIIDKNPPPYQPKLSMKARPGAATFYFSLKADTSALQDKLDFINSISYVRLEILNPKDSVIYKFDIEQLELEGKTGKDQQTALSTTGSADWYIPPKIDLKELKYRFKLFAGNQFFNVTKTYDELQAKESENEMQAVVLEPFVENVTANSADFGAIAKRMKNVDNEYCPTSDTFRVDILNHNGISVWSSSYGLESLQVLTPVLPKEKGETHKYTVHWNGMQSNVIPLFPGEYTLKMTIPAKPEPYTATLKFNWKTNGK